MSLDTHKLEKVVKLDSGIARARCPACAERGQDQSGNHLRIYPDGRFGCCVFPGDGEHRRRIFALAGDRSREGIKVRSVVKVAGMARKNILGRLGQVFPGPGEVQKTSDASDGVGEVETAWTEARTARTGETKSESDSQQAATATAEESRTLRTPFLNPRGYGKKVQEDMDAHTQEFCPPVRSVREQEEQRDTLIELDKGVRGVRESEAAVQPPIVQQRGVDSVHAESDEIERRMNESPY